MQTTNLVSLQHTLYNSRNPTRRWLHTTRRDRVIDAIKNAPVPSTHRAMEVGPGSGVYLPTLCQRFAQVVALDVEPSHIEDCRTIASQYPNLTLQLGDLCKIEWENKHDLVLCSEVLEHVPDPARFMKGLSKALNKNGMLVLSTPQPKSFMELTASIALSKPVIGLTRMIYREPVLPTGHISVTASSTVLRLMKENGLEIISSTYFGLYLPAIAEFGGGLGVSVLSAGQRLLQRIGPRGLLWTQLHVARKRG
ncbi:MAG TPA: class I SAM-dependent methyltransferase [Tepidisphaeraceae bacterium]|jgi:2-polyprenyl-3-methyl-5-hydroxy-6-metoxy-1,4-benzoquinol methylase